MGTIPFHVGHASRDRQSKERLNCLGDAGALPVAVSGTIYALQETARPGLDRHANDYPGVGRSKSGDVFKQFVQSLVGEMLAHLNAIDQAKRAAVLSLEPVNVGREDAARDDGRVGLS